jgi:glutaminase
VTRTEVESFGIAVVTTDGHLFEVGDSRAAFTIQSISKPFAFGMALAQHGREVVMQRVGVEPSGNAYNAIAVDATNRPFNPMVNAGAIVTTGLIEAADFAAREAELTRGFAAFAGRELAFDEHVYESERSTGDRNRALAYLMRSFGMVDGDVDKTVDLYFRQCSLLVDSCALAVMAATLANHGVNPLTGERALDDECVENVLSVMASCGMYDYAGDWAYRVGLPAKSGVAGGVVAVLPGQVGIGVFSPLLDGKGNSVRGIEVCRRLATDSRCTRCASGRRSLPSDGRTAATRRARTGRGPVPRTTSSQMRVDASRCTSSKAICTSVRWNACTEPSSGTSTVSSTSCSTASASPGSMTPRSRCSSTSSTRSMPRVQRSRSRTSTLGRCATRNSVCSARTEHAASPTPTARSSSARTRCSRPR